jgi:hypothetical protein
MGKVFAFCPKCQKKGYYEVAGYDPSPERGSLFKCRYCHFYKRAKNALLEITHPSMEDNKA